MQITPELVTYLEALGRIRLSPEEKKASEKDLQDILTYIDTLNELDTSDVEPLSHSFPVTNVFSKVEAPFSTDRELILQNAPQSDGVCFKVPKTVD